MARAVVFGASAVALCAWSLPASSSPARYQVDADDVANLRRVSPRAVELLERGETLATAGDVRGATRLFEQAAREQPRSALLLRRVCEGWTALRDSAKAVAGCEAAVQAGFSPLDVRAEVRALLESSPHGPTPGDVARALRLAEWQRGRAPDESWGYAMTCDIAEHTGDEVMLQQCVRQLQRVAPNDPATRKAISGLGPSWFVRAGWLAMAIAGLGTALHAAWRSALRRRRGAGAAAMASGVLVASLVACPARAWADATPAAGAAGSASGNAPGSPPAAASAVEKDTNRLSDWKVDDKDPSSSIPGVGQRNRNPLQFGYWLMDVTDKAQAASKRGDHEASARYYAALAKAVPDRAISFAKLCDEYDAMGERDKAVASCGQALFRDGLLTKDYVHYVHLLLQKDGKLSPAEVTSLDAVLKHLRETPNGEDTADILECDIGEKTEDVGLLGKCTTALAQKAPNDPKTIVYQWALAMLRGDYDQATQILAHLKTTSIAPERIQDFERATAAAAERHRTKVLWASIAALLALAALAVVAVGLRRRAALASHAPPGDPPPPHEPMTSEASP